MLNRAQSYKKVFTGPDAEAVLKDLFKFCRLAESLGPEPNALLMAEGRRQVFCRIAKYLNFDENTFLKMSERNNNHE